MNCPAASIRTIGDFACGDQLIHLDRSRTGSPARSIFAMQSYSIANSFRREWEMVFANSMVIVKTEWK